MLWQMSEYDRFRTVCCWLQNCETVQQDQFRYRGLVSEVISIKCKTVSEMAVFAAKST